jgi:hypothetical protein
MSQGFLVLTVMSNDSASAKVVDERAGLTAEGHASTLQEAFSALVWPFGMKTASDPKACQDLIEAAAFDVCGGPTAQNETDVLGTWSTLTLAVNILSAVRNAPGKEQTLSFIQQAAPVLASRVRDLLETAQGAVKALQGVQRAANQEEARQRASAGLEQAKNRGLTPESGLSREGAPFCPFCGKFTRPFPVQVPDPRFRASGQIPGRLVPMLTVNAWKCSCPATGRGPA